MGGAITRERFGRIGMVARWKPVHLGHAPVLHGLCEHSGHALVGIGSSNRYDHRNPFTTEETEHMIRLVLSGREDFTLLRVPDLDDGPRWRAMIVELFSPLDAFVTDNPYVASLLADDFHLLRPVELIAASERVAVDGTMVRREMALGNGWADLVPAEVAGFIRDHGLDDRFRREFGLHTLALDAPS